VNLTTVELVYENATAAVALHHDWAVRGHAMVISKRHVENIADLKEDEMMRFASVHRRAERAILDLTGAERAVIMKLGIVTPHLHLHIYPVSAALDRAAVMNIIEGRTKEPRDERFVLSLRERLNTTL
jgi:diadenosine tetraphosphate (Ap4A) HIT family hydrolase